MEKISCREQRQIKLLRNDPVLIHIFEDLAEERVQTPEEISIRRNMPVAKVNTALETLVDAELVSPMMRVVGGSVIYALSREGIKLERSGKYKEDCREYRF